MYLYVCVCGCTLQLMHYYHLTAVNGRLSVTRVSLCHSSCQVLEKFMSRLVQNRVMANKDLRTLSKYQLILARDQFRKNPPPYIKARTLFHESLSDVVSDAQGYSMQFYMMGYYQHLFLRCMEPPNLQNVVKVYQISYFTLNKE